MLGKLFVGTVAGLLCAAMAVVSVIGGAGIAQAAPLLQSENPPAAWIGVILADLNPQLAQRLGIDATSGVVVVRVLKDSPAEKGGLQVKDIVKAVGGQPVEKVKDFQQVIATATVGQPLTITVLRGTQEQQLTVTPTEVPPGVKRLRQVVGRIIARHEVRQLAARLNLLPGWKDIPKEQRFSHTLEATFRYKDKDGNVITAQTIPGVVVSASATSITITPNDPALPGGPFAITKDTAVRVGKNAGVESLKAGDQVSIVTADGKTALAVMKIGPLPVKPTPAGGQ